MERFPGELFDGGELRIAGGMCRVCKGLNVDVCILFDGVFLRDGANGLRDGENEFVGLFCDGVVKLRLVFRVSSFDNRGAGVVRAAGETLPEFFG